MNHPRRVPARRQARSWRALRVIFAVLIVATAAGCGTTLKSATCSELAAAAAGRHCAERVIDRPIPQPAPLVIEPAEDPPPLTAAALVDPPARDALRAIAEDLEASRAWGWRLHAQIERIRIANDSLAAAIAAALETATGGGVRIPPAPEEGGH